MSIRSASLIAIGIVFVCGCTSSTPAPPIDWSRQIGEVTAGMNRAEVMKLLPPLPESPRPTMAGGGSETVHYWVETNMAVRVTFGNNPSHTSSWNRLLFEPIISDQPMPGSRTQTKDPSNKPSEATP